MLTCLVESRSRHIQWSHTAVPPARPAGGDSPGPVHEERRGAGWNTLSTNMAAHKITEESQYSDPSSAGEFRSWCKTPRRQTFILLWLFQATFTVQMPLMLPVSCNAQASLTITNFTGLPSFSQVHNKHVSILCLEFWSDAIPPPDKIFAAFFFLF